MTITILTMFPECFSSLYTFPVVRRALDKGLLELRIVDIKEVAYGGTSIHWLDDEGENNGD